MFLIWNINARDMEIEGKEEVIGRGFKAHDLEGGILTNINQGDR